MQPGRMDRRVTLLKRSLTQLASGEYTEAFTPMGTVWAEVKELRGTEFFSARQDNESITTRFYLRYRSDLTVLDRITYNGMDYNIEQVSEMGRRDGLDILASVVNP